MLLPRATPRASLPPLLVSVAQRKARVQRAEVVALRPVAALREVVGPRRMRQMELIRMTTPQWHFSADADNNSPKMAGN